MTMSESQDEALALRRERRSPSGFWLGISCTCRLQFLVPGSGSTIHQTGRKERNRKDYCAQHSGTVSRSMVLVISMYYYYYYGVLLYVKPVSYHLPWYIACKRCIVNLKLLHQLNNIQYTTAARPRVHCDLMLTIQTKIVQIYSRFPLQTSIA